MEANSYGPVILFEKLIELLKIKFGFILQEHDQDLLFKKYGLKTVPPDHIESWTKHRLCSNTEICAVAKHFKEKRKLNVRGLMNAYAPESTTLESNRLNLDVRLGDADDTSRTGSALFKQRYKKSNMNVLTENSVTTSKMQ